MTDEMDGRVRQEQGIFSSSMCQNRLWSPPASELTIIRHPFVRVKLKQRKDSSTAKIKNTCPLFQDVGTR
jgi:hypothetical protein